MKRLLCIVIVLSFMLPFFGCKSNTIESPLPLYFLRKSQHFGSEDSIFFPEIVDSTQFASLSSMLRFYLQGPIDSTLKSPFPKNIYLVEVEISEDILIITLSDSLATLTGVDLSLACCALAKTTYAFNGIETVQIQARSALLDGEASITIHIGDIVLFDDYSTAATGSTQ